MTREIKFRAWNINEKYMIYLESSGLQYYDFEGNYSLGFTVDGYDGFRAHEQYKKAIEDASNFPIMQFTGLKDKNGKEIYEGDIVEIVYSNVPNGFKMLGRETVYKKVFGVVEFSDGCFFIKHTNPETKEVVESYLYKILERNPKEIKGNIYENPDLLSN